MAQISDVMHASAVFDAARQELAWASGGDDFDVPERVKDAVHDISKVLNEAEMQWVTSTREPEPVAAAVPNVDKKNAMAVAAVDKKNAMAVVATGHEEEEKKRVVKQVDTRSIGEAERKIKRWLERLEEIACDMRAVARKELLGGYSRIDDHKLQSARWLPCLPRTRRAARIADPTIDTVAYELEKLKKQYDKEFGHSTGLPLAATCTEQPSCSSNAAGGQEERDTGITGDGKQRIIDIITVHTENRGNYTTVILPIFGPPCIGKTTIVKSVFHDDTFKACYKVWVDMRKGWDVQKIHESIIEEIERHQDGFLESAVAKYWKQNISHTLWHMQKELLLVFDNLEEQDCSMFDKLLESVMINQRHVSAIIITRSEYLARSIARRSEIAEFRLSPCSDDMCWKIIKQTSGLDLEATAEGTVVALSEMDGRKIASKCSGRSFAAKALGRFLQSLNPKEWPDQTRDVWNIGGGFSRNSLPNHSATVFAHMKSVLDLGYASWLFLAYCAFVFPKGKGHGVVRYDLLNQWCSLGVTTLERGVSCISGLLGHSLLLREKNASAEDATLLTMEDLMHDFARYLLGDRLIVVDGKNGATPPSTSPPLNNKSSSAYFALVRNFDAKQLDISSILPAGILALRFELCVEMELNDGAFESFGKYLRLLDLSGYSEKKMLPDFIRHLKQLRYLKAPGIQDQELPRSITGLRELSYLILQGSCQLEALTEAFQWLSNLLHLDLSGCSGLKKLPNSFGRLWRLEYLDLSCSGIEALPKSFGWLRDMRHLVMSRCSALQDLPESFGMLASLRHLDLSHCSGLKALPDSFGSLRLKRLNLSACSGIEALPESFVSLPNLSHLDLSRCSGLKALPESFGGLNTLSYLDLSRCSELQDLPKSFQDLTELQHLDLSRLQARLMVKLPIKLRHLNLSGCSALQENQLPEVQEHSELRHLDLSGCSSVSKLPLSYVYDLKGLVHLNLSGCSSLTKLPVGKGNWSRKLEHLDLSDCSSLTKTGGVPHSSELENLRYLDLSGCFRIPESGIVSMVDTIRSRGGRASGPQDASLRCLPVTSPTKTNVTVRAGTISHVSAYSQDNSEECNVEEREKKRGRR